MSNEIPEEIKQKIDDLHNKSEFVVSWFAKKYDKTIFRLGNMSKPGCRTWEQGGKKYMCFWDVVIERYTTCINPMITYKKARN
tara:strand:+ start:249 stop:497 length:249 start_codon:yes stop_codon:yes gene_type:complete